MTTNTITISYGAVSVTLPFIDVKTIYPSREKNFTTHILEDGSNVVDEAPQSKRQWTLKHDVPLTTQERIDLNTLCYTYGNVTLVEDWADSGTYNVHFKSLQQRFDVANGSTKYVMEFQEL